MRFFELLCLKRCRPLNFLDGRRIPFASQRLGLRAIETHAQVERPLRRGQPVGFLILAPAFILEIRIERAVCVVRIGLKS